MTLGIRSLRVWRWQMAWVISGAAMLPKSMLKILGQPCTVSGVASPASVGVHVAADVEGLLTPDTRPAQIVPTVNLRAISTTFN